MERSLGHTHLILTPRGNFEAIIQLMCRFGTVWVPNKPPRQAQHKKARTQTLVAGRWLSKSDIHAAWMWPWSWGRGVPELAKHASSVFTQRCSNLSSNCILRIFLLLPPTAQQPSRERPLENNQGLHDDADAVFLPNCSHVQSKTRDGDAMQDRMARRPPLR